MGLAGTVTGLVRSPVKIPQYENVLNENKSNNRQLQREMFKPEEKDKSNNRQLQRVMFKPEEKDKSNNLQLQREMFKPEDGLDFMDKMKVIQYMHGKEVGKRVDWAQRFAAAEKEDEYLDNKSRKCQKLYNQFGKLGTNCLIKEI
ncbi:Hypothetical predicted protein [Mytilus galloprovincialis]|uniref:Uncharacterized protein n=1 Tax=Mytilus galloprovincialis TaxID=29158 RepID=A0A8B6EWI1_MYTGA|nr:Hypothetical predicted protein [Mytilus galloprovincialis]